MRPQSEILLQQLKLEIQQRYPDYHLTDLRIIGQGLEALVCRATTALFGDVAIKVPWTRFESNENDAWVDNRALLRQEALVAQHLALYGLPVPAIHQLHVEGALDFLVSSFIENDGSAVPGHQLGEVLARIHQSPLPPVQAGGLQSNLPDRIEQRLKVVAQQTDLSFALPPGWKETLAHPGARQAILHMDFRPANLLSHGGNLMAVVDWSNLLIGDPALELARVAEYGLLDEGFLAGYGIKDPFAHLPRGVETLYRLDTAVMLALVFLSEAPDPDLAKRQVERVQLLYRRIIAESRR